MNRRFLLFNFLSAATARYLNEVCERYRSTHNVKLAEPSFCNDAGICENLSVTCKAAFEDLINLQKRLIDIPPILLEIDEYEMEEMRVNGAMYLIGQRPSYMPVDVPELRAFQEAVEIVIERIFDAFPYMVFDMEIDGMILTQLVERATQLASRLSLLSFTEQGRARWLIYQSNCFQKLTWAIRVIFHHLAVPGKTTNELKLLFVAFAPVVHAYLHATHLLKVHISHLFESRTTEDIILCMARYHPLYTLDDGVWYIRMSGAWFDWHRIFTHTHIPRDSNDLELVLSMISAVPDITIVPSAPHSDTDPVPPFITVVKWDSFVSPRTDRHFDALKIAQYAFRIMREKYGTFFVSHNFPIHTLSSIMATPVSHASIALADMVNEVVPAHLLLNQLVSMSKTPAPILRRNIRIRLAIRQSHFVHDLLHEISMLTIFGLAILIEIKIDDHQPAPLYDSIRNVLEHIYEKGPLLNGHRRYKIALGRLFALAIQFRKGLDVLVRLITSNQGGIVESPTIHETIFFNSHYIRSGFYDIYHEGMLESLFRNNGTRLIEALSVPI